jgi:hypothetical protein
MALPRILVVTVVLVLLCGTSMAASRKIRKSPPVTPAAKDSREIKTGRYQLLQGRYNSNDMINDSSAPREDLILLDTATGELRICVQKIWTNTALDKEISQRACLPFETYSENPVGTFKTKK